jgi:hypothetical protein
VRKLKGTQLEDLTWMGQVNVKNGVVKLQAKSNWTADGCDKFCIQNLVCILLQKSDYSKDEYQTQYMVLLQKFLSTDTYSTSLPFLLHSKP